MTMSDLPKISSQKFNPTRDHLRDVALVLGSLQRAFLPAHPRDWQHGLEVNMRGMLTQPFSINGKDVRASIDLVTHKVRIGENTHWKLDEYGGSELFKNVRIWLESRGIKSKLEVPEFSGTAFYDREIASKYAEAVWWLERQFQTIKAELKGGVTSPVLLYPHHFDLSLTWFPSDDDKQLGFGWSTGDDTISEPYFYFTAYPEPHGFTDLELPEGAYWQTQGFSGAILPYSILQASKKPDLFIQKFAYDLFLSGSKLLS